MSERYRHVATDDWFTLEIERLRSKLTDTERERDGLNAYADKLASKLSAEQARVAHLEGALARLIGGITAGDCYKHLPDVTLKDARAALAASPTMTVDPEEPKDEL